MKIIEYSNYTIKIGKNAQDNWNILSSANQKDLLFHLHSFPSPYVILHATKITPEMIDNAAQLCITNSKYADFQMIKVEYTPCKNAIRGNKVGEMIYKNKKLVKLL